MAEYRIAIGDNAVEPYVTTANQVDTITFAESVERVVVVSNGQAEVRLTNDGSTPHIGQPGSSTACFRLPAGMVSVRDIPLPDVVDVVKIVASGAAQVSIEIQR